MNLTGWTKTADTVGSTYERRLTRGVVVRLYEQLNGRDQITWFAAAYPNREGEYLDSRDSVAVSDDFAEPEHAFADLRHKLDGVEMTIREAKQALGEL